MILKQIPRRTILLPLAALVWNQLLYQGAFRLAEHRTHYDLSTPLDRVIPLVPWTLIIYFGCFLFWGLHYLWMAARNDESARRFYRADFLSKAVCFVIFLLLPTVMHRPEITGTGFWAAGMRFLYWMDQPYNLFPSVHCLLSWLCWVSVRGRADIPRWYRALAFWLALAVFVSTLTTRQHVLVDIAGGVGVAELCWRAVRSSAPDTSAG